jgi:hypothetical protein
LITSGGWDVLELEFPKWKGSMEDSAVSRRVINYDKLKRLLSYFNLINLQALME